MGRVGSHRLDNEITMIGCLDPKVWTAVLPVHLIAIVFKKTMQVDFPEAGVEGALKLSDEFAIPIGEAIGPIGHNGAFTFTSVV
ncbi:hypothetical protein CBM2588_A40074 [Cupriavidus taiwanensis]|nr:hypothetical protein CBM2588_A40074 [Cupriavidus taiwanensis]